jgi:predicted nucleotidyltransferase
MRTQKSAIRLVKDYIQACNEAGIRMNKVYLFGSVASKKNTDESDIDIALVSDSFTSDRLANRKKLTKINIRFSLIEPHTFSIKYFEKGDPFIDEIKRNGILID